MVSGSTPSFRTGHLYSPVNTSSEAEYFEPLIQSSHCKVERIVSHGHSTPPDEWHDQTSDEWVVLLAGAAKLEIEGHPSLFSLDPGDYIFLPAHLRHRVAWTVPDRDTVWLAIHLPKSAN